MLPSEEATHLNRCIMNWTLQPYNMKIQMQVLRNGSSVLLEVLWFYVLPRCYCEAVPGKSFLNHGISFPD